MTKFISHRAKLLLPVILLSMFLISCNDKETEAKQIKKAETTTNNGVDLIKPDTAKTTYVLGKDYISLPLAYDTDNKEQVVVYEFFGYTCPHCFTFEPYINKWLENKPDYVQFVRVPLNFQPAWADFQQAYLTAEAMGIVDQSHTKMFEALHKDNKRLNNMEEIAQWYADETGTDKETFLSTSESFVLDSKLRKADSMGHNMQVTSTPTLIINGKYSAAKKIHGRDEIMKILDFLVEKEAKTMGLIAK